MKAGKENAVDLTQALGNYGAIGQFERRADQILRHFEQLFGKWHQFGRGQAAMALVQQRDAEAKESQRRRTAWWWQSCARRSLVEDSLQEGKEQGIFRKTG
jgi:hypothetical protein